MNIGMRYIKTALAVFLSLVLSRAMHSEFPFFAAIAAVISMETTMAGSVAAGKNRMLGTLLGAAVGLALVLVLPKSALLSSLGIILIIYLCNRLGWNSAISIATIVFLAIMINLNDQDPLSYSIGRLADTLLGIVVALVVNYLVVPFDNTAQLEALSDTLKESLRRSPERWEAAEAAAYREQTEALRQQYELFCSQYRNRMRRRDLEERIQQELEQHGRMMMHLDCLQELKDNEHDPGHGSEASAAAAYHSGRVREIAEAVGGEVRFHES